MMQLGSTIAPGVIFNGNWCSIPQHGQTSRYGTPPHWSHSATGCPVTFTVNLNAVCSVDILNG
ncbi:MAG: hypothetical protein ABI970_22375, partial [Chloroflexota bacterium]